MHRSLRLIVCPVPGNPLKQRDFQQKLPIFSCPLGALVQRNSTTLTLENGWSFVVKGKLISIYTNNKSSIIVLKSLQDMGLSYSAINTARSALSTIISVPDCHTFGSHPLVTRFMKGVYEKLKPQPKYTQIWDVSLVLKYLATLKLNSLLSLKNLTLKLVMLLSLVSSQRGQTIHSLSQHCMKLSESSCQFQILEHKKTSKPETCATVIKVHKHEPDADICPFLTLKKYLKQTQRLRGNANILVIYCNLYYILGPSEL